MHCSSYRVETLERCEVAHRLRDSSNLENSQELSWQMKQSVAATRPRSILHLFPASIGRVQARQPNQPKSRPDQQNQSSQHNRARQRSCDRTQVQVVYGQCSSGRFAAGSRGMNTTTERNRAGPARVLFVGRIANLAVGLGSPATMN